MAGHLTKNITIYELPNCPQCNATKRHFDKLGKTYRVESATEHADMIRGKGYTTAPVVVVYKEDGTTESWSGYNVGKIQSV